MRWAMWDKVVRASIALLLVFSICLPGLGQNPINPVTQIRWPLITGAGSPIGTITCQGNVPPPSHSATFGQPYWDGTNDLLYMCGNDSAWHLVSGTGGSTVFVNNNPVSSPNFNPTTPATSAGYIPVNFQVTGSNVSAQVAAPVSVTCGGTNDTAAIQAALATGAIKVQLNAPSGTCQMGPTSGGLTASSNTVLDLGGANLSYSPTTATIMLTNAAEAQVPNRTITGCIATAGSTTINCAGGAFTTADFLQSIDCLTALGAGNNYDLHTSIVNITSSTAVIVKTPPGQNVNPATCKIIYRDTNIVIQNGTMTLGGSLAALASQPMIYFKSINNLTLQNLVMNEPGVAGAFHINVADATNVLEQNLTFFSTQLQQDGIDNIGPIEGVSAKSIYCNTGDDCVDIATSFASSPVTGLNDQTIYGDVNGVEYAGIYGSSTSANDAVKIFLNIPGNITNVHIHDIVGGPYIFHKPTINSFPGFSRGVDVLIDPVGLTGTAGTMTNIKIDHVGGVIGLAPVFIRNLGGSSGSIGNVTVSSISNDAPVSAGEALVQVALAGLSMTNLKIDMPFTSLPASELLLSTASGTTITNLFTNNTTPSLYSLSGTITNTYITPLVTGPITSGHCPEFVGTGGNIEDSGAACSGGGSPGGSSGQTQYNNSGVFGGYTPTGDCTVVVTTGVFTCTKTGGVAFVASATTDTTNATNIGSGTLAHARLPALVSGDIPNNAANTTGQANTAVSLAGGAIGNIPYQSGAGATAFLAGNTAATDQVLTSTGTGSAAQAPTLKNAPALAVTNMVGTGGFSTTGNAATATGLAGTFAAHHYYGNSTASTAAGASTLIGPSDTGPNTAAVCTGTVNALVLTITQPATDLSYGLQVQCTPNLANTTTTPTLNVSGLGTKTITKNGGAALAANDLTTTAVAFFFYDGTEFQLIDPQTSSSAGGVTCTGCTANTISKTTGTGTLGNSTFIQNGTVNTFGAADTASAASFDFGNGANANGTTTTVHGATPGQGQVIFAVTDNTTRFSVDHSSVHIGNPITQYDGLVMSTNCIGWPWAYCSTNAATALTTATVNLTTNANGGSYTLCGVATIQTAATAGTMSLVVTYNNGSTQTVNATTSSVAGTQTIGTALATPLATTSGNYASIPCQNIRVTNASTISYTITGTALTGSPTYIPDITLAWSRD